ncbi:MAG: hypothetical protein FJ035_09755 [Chloroflexi bacterium]|nr:hypothetical protein [Chloroflexota bacterium]
MDFERGDLVVFRSTEAGTETQQGGIVLALSDGLLTVALPHGVEVWNMRATRFVSAWRVEHTPGAMTEDEALAFAARRLGELARRPLVMVAPEDDRAFGLEAHAQHHAGAHAHEHAAMEPRYSRAAPRTP